MSNEQPVHLDPNRRHDFILLFDCQDGNPNGDPDAGNLPRVDPETAQGLVTDVAIKRKVRDFVDLARGSEERFKIYVQQYAVLNDQHQRAYTDLKIESKGSKQPKDDVDRTRKWMCDNFYDVRMFGAVMSTGVNCGQVRGPLQLTFARSFDPVMPLDITITRVAVTKAGEDKNTEMGRKALIPYGLYRSHGFYSPSFAQKTGVKSEDLELFWRALQMMWDVDHSAARGMMACQGIYIFSHSHPLGDAPAHKLFDRLNVKAQVEAPRSFRDYAVSLDEAAMPEGVTLTKLSV